MTVWFTIKLDDRPGAIGRLGTALGDRNVNIRGIVGVAEDTDGALMLETSDPDTTRQIFTELGIVFEDHDPTSGEGHGMTIGDVVAGRRG